METWIWIVVIIAAPLIALALLSGTLVILLAGAMLLRGVRLWWKERRERARPPQARVRR